MRLLRPAVYRLVATLLLAWFVGGAVAAPLMLCCDEAEPCCVVAQTVRGCHQCASAPVVADHTVNSAALPPSVQPAALVDPALVSVAYPPWKPPD